LSNGISDEMMERKVLKLAGEMNCRCRWSWWHRKLHLDLLSAVYGHVVWLDCFSTKCSWSLRLTSLPETVWSYWQISVLFFSRNCSFQPIILVKQFFLLLNSRLIFNNLASQNVQIPNILPSPHQTLDYA